jgi:predicted permease
MAADRITSLVRQSGGSPGDRWRAIVTRLGDSYIAQVRPIFWSAGAGAALMLLIASANAAVLLLVRGRARHKELAVRLALGASDARLARLLGMEGIILGTAATAAGVMLVGAAIGGLAPFIESFLDRRAPGGPGAFALDGTVLLAAAGCGVAVTVLITLAPVLICFKADLAGQLSSAGRGSTEAPGSRRAQSVLIGIEVAASLALLTGAVLMADSMARMLDVEFGIRAESVASTGLGLRQRSYPDAASRAAFYERLVRRLQGVGGSASVALGDWRLLQAPRPRPIETRNPAPAAARATAFTVSDAFFSTLGIAVEDGRPFDARDRLGAGSVAVVSRSLAARLWPGARAVGREITVELDEGLPPVPCLVVGVVNDVRQRHADDDLFDVYLPLAQQPGRFASIYVRAPRSTAWETELRAAVAEIDRDVALGAPQSLDEALQQERARPRFVAWLLAALATFAALLTLVGVHGVIAYATGARRREIAVRMAVGATPRSVTTLFLRDGGAVLGAGLLAGIAGGLALGRVLEGLLYGVGPGEPRVLVAATLALGLSGLLAIWWPARRAARTDPASVLREA